VCYACVFVLRRSVHDALEDRPMNSVRFTGAFSLSQCHEWAAYLLEGVPPKCVAWRGGGMGAAVAL
jgi:hypothetical protein